MICEDVTVETGNTKLSHRFGPEADEQLKALPKSPAKECRNRPPYPAVAVGFETLWDRSADDDENLQWLVREPAKSIFSNCYDTRLRLRCRTAKANIPHPAKPRIHENVIKEQPL